MSYEQDGLKAQGSRLDSTSLTFNGGRSLFILGGPHLGEGRVEPGSGADEPRQHLEIITTHSQDPAVEVLPLHLDGGEETLQDLALRASNVIEAGEINRDLIRRWGFGGVMAVRGEELGNGNVVIAGKTVQARNRQAALSPFVRPKDGGLEFAVGEGLNILE